MCVWSTARKAYILRSFHCLKFIKFKKKKLFLIKKDFFRQNKKNPTLCSILFTKEYTE